jgi:hypothetical protein
MRQSLKEVEHRLRQVEKDLGEIKASLAADARQPWFRQIAGSFAQDPGFAEIIRLGRLIRQGKLNYPP